MSKYFYVTKIFIFFSIFISAFMGEANAQDLYVEKVVESIIPSEVYYKISIKNNTSEPFEDIKVVDAKLAPITAGDDYYIGRFEDINLAPGQTLVLSALTPELPEYQLPSYFLTGSTDEQIENCVDVTVHHTNTNTLPALYESTNNCIQFSPPSIYLEKTTSDTYSAEGDIITYHFTVTNTGGFPLTNAMFVDEKILGPDNFLLFEDLIDGYVGTFYSGEVYTFDLEYTVTEEDVANRSIENIASVFADYPGYPVGYDASFTVTADPLSVDFGAINASIINGNLSINWASLNEKNNSHYEVEYSLDGKNFKPLGKVITKAENGNSDSPIEYSLEMPLSGLTLGGLLFGIALFGMSFVKRRNWQWFIGVALIVGSIAVSCNKNNADVFYKNAKTLYIRIVSVDLDGYKDYSKVVKVAKDK